MAGSILPAFEQAMDGFLTGLDAGTKLQFKVPHTEADIRSLIGSLEQEQAARSEMMNLGRILPFVNGLSQFAGVIEVFVQAKPEILSLIWVSSESLLSLSDPYRRAKNPWFGLSRDP